MKRCQTDLCAGQPDQEGYMWLEDSCGNPCRIHRDCVRLSRRDVIVAGDGAVPVPGRPQQLLRGARQPGAGARRGGRAENQAHPAQCGRPALPGHEPPPAGLPLPRTSLARSPGQAREPSLSDSDSSPESVRKQVISMRSLPLPAP